MHRCKYFLLGILLFPCITTFYNNFEDNEVKVAFAVFKELKIHHCVLVADSPYSDVINYRKIYNNNIFVAFIQNKNLKDFFSKKSLYFKIGIVMKMHTINILNDLFEKNPVKVSEFTWLIFGNENIANEFIIPYNCEFLTVQSEKTNEYLVKEIYFIKNNGPFVIDFGIWSDKSGLILNKEFDEQRKDMRGTTFIRGDSNGFNICNNFTTEIKHREMWLDYSWLLNFSMMVVNDMLYNDSTDPMQPDGSPCGYGQHSLNYFPDMIQPTFLLDLYMVIKFENDFGEGWKSYFKPFDEDLWYSILIFLILSTTSFIIIGYFTKSFDINPFTTIYSFCFQGGEDLDENINLSFSIAYLMPYIAAAVIVPAYSAAILAKLTVQLPKVPFTDLETFAKDGTYKLGGLNHTFVIKYFKRNDHPLVSQIYNSMFLKENEYPNVYEEAANKLCTDKNFAFIPYELDLFEGVSNCKLFKIPTLIFYIHCGFRMRPGSPFSKMFKELLVKFHTSGTMNRINKTNIIKRRTLDNELFTSITISHVLPILNLIPIGMALSLTSLVIEIFIKRKKK